MFIDLMGHPPHLIVPDSSVKALILQQRSSSSPSSSIDSPTEPPSSHPTSPPSQQPSQVSNARLDLSLPSASSSSSNLVPEIPPVQEKNVRQRRRKKLHVHGKRNDDGIASNERSMQVTPHTSRRDSAHAPKRRKGCQDSVCCKCAAGFTADCAAVCCCPLALLHLAALTFIRLPTAVAWKMLVNLKNKIYRKRRPPKDGEEDSPRLEYRNPWSYEGSPEGTTNTQAVRFDSEKLWQHFEGGNLDFGGISMRREPL